MNLPELRARTCLIALSLALVPGLGALAAAEAPAAYSASFRPQETLTGFDPERIPAQLACEARLVELPRPEQFREHLRTITAEPHPAGSEAQRRVEDYLATTMESAGLEVERYPYDVYLPQLTDDVAVEIVAPERIPLSNREAPVDRFTDHPELLNGWNAFSGSGDVTGEVVYANYGRKEDYDRLVEMGVDLTDKIVVARYGGNFRGYKVKFAEAHGAAGVIMFNDPGRLDRPAYPEGPWMSPTTIQRGSVLTLDWTGDPLTPFEPALPLDHPDTPERLDPDTVGLHTIPVLPLGYGPAAEILERMTGPEAPEDWHGPLPLTYRVTGGPELRVRVRVDQPKALTRAVNVVGTIRGTEFPDEWIILGAHYDPWGFGAIDPNGGTAMLLTMGEALAELAADGCAPRRSIMVAHWDAEEYGIIGSAEWVEQLSDELAANTVAYINADSAVSGPNFGASSSPSLKQLIVEATRAVPYPGTDGSVYDWWAERGEGEAPQMGNLGGGGSDHVGFYSHVGIPSGSLGFGGASGVYHSNYDNFAWFENFGDVDFVFGPTLAALDGIVALRLANADVLPYDVVRYAQDLRGHAETIEALAGERGWDVSLGEFHAAIDELEVTAGRWHEARDAGVDGTDFPARTLRALNAGLIALEKAFIHEEGLQGRPWYRSLYATPDPFSGYASWMLPGLRYEIETDNRPALEAWQTIYVQAVEDLTTRVHTLTEELSAAR